MTTVEKNREVNFVVTWSGLVLIATITLLLMYFGIFFSSITAAQLNLYAYYLLIAYVSALFGYFFAKHVRTVCR